MGKFVIRTVPSGIKFDLRAANGQVILTSEVYTTMAACRKGIGKYSEILGRAYESCAAAGVVLYGVEVLIAVSSFGLKALILKNIVVYGGIVYEVCRLHA